MRCAHRRRRWRRRRASAAWAWAWRSVRASAAETPIHSIHHLCTHTKWWPGLFGGNRDHARVCRVCGARGSTAGLLPAPPNAAGARSRTSAPREAAVAVDVLSNVAVAENEFAAPPSPTHSHTRRGHTRPSTKTPQRHTPARCLPPEPVSKKTPPTTHALLPALLPPLRPPRLGPPAGHDPCATLLPVAGPSRRSVAAADSPSPKRPQRFFPSLSPPPPFPKGEKQFRHLPSLSPSLFLSNRSHSSGLSATCRATGPHPLKQGRVRIQRPAPLSTQGARERERREKKKNLAKTLSRLHLPSGDGATRRRDKGRLERHGG